MGLFGPKISKDEKMYQKALKDALHKPNAKNINEMKAALETNPDSWQGYWICAVYHDQGFDSERDEAKAQEYFKKAEDAARGTDHEVWMQEFMKWYGRAAGHLQKPIDEKTERARRLGIAMCYCNLLGDLFLTAPYEKYSGDWYVMCQGILARLKVEYDETEPFDNFLSVCEIDRNSQIKDTNKVLDRSSKYAEGYEKCINAIRDGKEPNWEKYIDMYDYLIGVNCIYGGKLLTEEVADNSDFMNEAEMGVYNFLTGAIQGCQPSIHEVTRLAKASQDNFEVVERTFQSRKMSVVWGGDLDRFLKEQLEKCIEKNDAEAKRLYQIYYQ